MLKRKGRKSEAVAENPVEAEAGQHSEPEPQVERRGPFDAEDLEEDQIQDLGYRDFGAVLVLPQPGLSIQLQQDPSNGRLVSLTLILERAAVQVRVLAAPRSGGLWVSQRDAMLAQITASGGSATTVDGAFGDEVHALVPPPAEHSESGPHRLRFVGVEGPRWLLTGSFLGEGAVQEKSGRIEEVFRNLVVVRGEEAMPPGALIYFKEPQGVLVDEDQEEGAPPTIEALEPSARITETR